MVREMHALADLLRGMWWPISLAANKMGKIQLKKFMIEKIQSNNRKKRVMTKFHEGKLKEPSLNFLFISIFIYARSRKCGRLIERKDRKKKYKREEKMKSLFNSNKDGWNY